MNTRAAVLIASLLAAHAAFAGDDAVQMKLLPQGAMPKLGGYMPQKVQLSATKPETITKLPAGLEAPVYGLMAIAGAEKAKYHVVLDEPEGKPARLFVDANGNGDLTDDPDADWTSKTAGKSDDGKDLMQFSGGSMVNLGTEAKPYQVHIAMYRFDKSDAKRAALKDVLLYYRDYATEGEAKIGGKTYKVMLADNFASGDYRAAGDKDAGVRLLVDVNGNGKFESQGETFNVKKPFNIGGTTYEVTDISKDGLSFKIAKSSQTVAEEPLDPDLGVGKPVVAFEAKMMDGKTVKFPGDYKGKVVMLDFWATWCGPCMHEVPNVVAAYEKYHKQGFEILGVTLDQKNADEKIKSVTADKKMTWAQVYDGGYWDARVAKLYGIHGIPAAYLVDGDTGKIIATDLRGAALDPAIEKALGAKNKH